MWNIHRFAELSSTNDYARELLNAGKAQHGDVFQADHQSAGRGRIANRKWQDEAGESLLMTVVLQDLPRTAVELAPYFTALCIASSIRTYLQGYVPAFDQSRVRVKWPNDLLLDGRKFCGILSEAVWNGEELRGVLLGIGMNVSQRSFAPELRAKATSLSEIAHRTIEVTEVLNRILSTLRSCLERIQTIPAVAYKASVLSDLRIELGWMTHLPSFEVELADGECLRGVRYRGIAEDGALIVRLDNGEEKRLFGGTLSISEVPFPITGANVR